MEVHRKNNFDFVRLVAASFVLVSHMFALMGQQEPVVVGDHSLGNIGLLIFFAVSGYLVTISWTRDPDVARFVQRRLLRIWPGMAVSVLVGLLVIAPIYSGSLGAGHDGLAYLRNLFVLRPYQELDVFITLPHRGLNGSLWTIPIEVWCYVCLVASGLVFRSHIRTVFPGLIVALFLYFVFIYGGQERLDSAHGNHGLLLLSTYLAAFFLMGSILALYEPSIFAGPALPLAAVVLACAFLAAGQTMIGLWLALPVTVIMIGRASWPAARDAGRFGDFSYGIYLYAWPVQQMVVHFGGVHRSVTLMTFLSAALVLPCAFLSWHAIEKWALRMKPSKPAVSPPDGEKTWLPFRPKETARRVADHLQKFRGP